MHAQQTINRVQVELSGQISHKDYNNEKEGTIFFITKMFWVIIFAKLFGAVVIAAFTNAEVDHDQIGLALVLFLILILFYLFSFMIWLRVKDKVTCALDTFFDFMFGLFVMMMQPVACYMAMGKSTPLYYFL